MRLLPGREKSGLIINNPQQTMFLFVDKHVKQVNKFDEAWDLFLNKYLTFEQGLGTGVPRRGVGILTAMPEIGVLEVKSLLSLIGVEPMPTNKPYLATELQRKKKKNKFK